MTELIKAMYGGKEYQTSGIYMYRCDPTKNVDCAKSICHIHPEGCCELTKEACFAKDDDAKPYYPLISNNGGEYAFVLAPAEEVVL